ncbi:MAG: ATP-binding cassette domain-containing protein, partial [Chloroflexota bacterium]|nr:ATP-binding cassette domain-containing protein [Chloroflexota bacterium]
MIELEDVSFTYRLGENDAVPALRDINLGIGRGEFVAVIGHNGCGKSTLSKLLTAVLYPTAGRITIDGIRVAPPSRWEVRRRV